jgi:hypothetical protein
VKHLASRGPQGAAWYFGSPVTVARKIAAKLPAVGATRFDLVGLSHRAVMTTIELSGTEVALRERALLDGDQLPRTVTECRPSISAPLRSL